tara:strand:- start:1220 stop:1630 length:411 start_codon:yes stop_codon:yes gene_type:complete
MINTLLNGFIPVTGRNFDERLRNMTDAITRDPYFTEMENFLHKPVLNYHSESNDEGYILEIPVPGLSKKDVKVSTNENSLVIKYENADEKWIGTTERSFTMPKQIEVESITAKVENGLLTISLPYAEKVKKTITVE